jgi:tetratricopeptide (TPR) repeat protein
MTAGALALALFAAGPAVVETPAAREQARQCEITVGEESLRACRRALEMGLSPGRLVPVRQIVARRLAALERWDELARHFEGDVALRPDDATAWSNLGAALLFGQGRLAEAEAALAEAVRLAPDAALAHALLALTLAGRGRAQDAAAAFESALRLDERLFEDRPAMALAYEAARRGEPWP